MCCPVGLFAFLLTVFIISGIFVHKNEKSAFHIAKSALSSHSKTARSISIIVSLKQLFVLIHSLVSAFKDFGYAFVIFIS